MSYYPQMKKMCGTILCLCNKEHRVYLLGDIIPSSMDSLIFSCPVLKKEVELGGINTAWSSDSYANAIPVIVRENKPTDF